MFRLSRHLQAHLRSQCCLFLLGSPLLFLFWTSSSNFLRQVPWDRNSQAFVCLKFNWFYLPTWVIVWLGLQWSVKMIFCQNFWGLSPLSSNVMRNSETSVLFVSLYMTYEGFSLGNFSDLLFKLHVLRFHSLLWMFFILLCWTLGRSFKYEHPYPSDLRNSLIFFIWSFLPLCFLSSLFGLLLVWCHVS